MITWESWLALVIVALAVLAAGLSLSVDIKLRHSATYEKSDHLRVVNGVSHRRGDNADETTFGWRFDFCQTLRGDDWPFAMSRSAAKPQPDMPDTPLLVAVNWPKLHQSSSEVGRACHRPGSPVCVQTESVTDR